MAGIPFHAVIEHIRRLHDASDAAQRSDRELLRAFAANNDQDAFTAVVTRHASLVWGVCRRILGHLEDAEDAFQATFLILARRAGSTRWQPSVGGWLYTVAHRLAVRTQKRAERRRACEREASRIPQTETSLRELAAVVDEELRRLPTKYRDPLLVHYLEGATAEAAARQLGLSRCTFYNRLTRGRELLRGRLSRQGLSLAAPLLAAALAHEAEAAAPSLIQSTLRGVRASAPSRVAALAAEAVRNTLVTKLKVCLAMGVLLGVAAGGVAMLTPRVPMSPASQAERPADQPKADDKPARRVDRYGDPLPEGAVARLGTLRFRVPSQIKTLAFSPDGKTLAVSSHVGLFLMDAVSGKRIKRLPTLGRRWTPEDHLAFSPDSKRLICIGPKKVGNRSKAVVRVWEVAGDRPPREYEMKEAGFLIWLGWSANGEPLAIRDVREALFLHELASGQSRRFACKEPAKSESGNFRDSLFAYAPAGQALALVDNNNAIHVWDSVTGRRRCILQLKNAEVQRLTLSPDGRTVASLNLDLPLAKHRSVQLWDVASGKLLHTVATEQKYLTTIAFAPDGKTLATAGGSGMHFWDVATGREKGRSQGEGADTECIAFSGDGRTLAAVERNTGAFHLWDVATGKRQSEPMGHRAAPYGAEFSPDGCRMASCRSLDGTIHVWDTASGKALVHIHRRGQWVRDAVFSADGRSLFSTWLDDELWISDAASSERRHVLKLEDPDRPDTKQSAWAMRLSDDGKTLIVFSYYHPKKNGAGPRSEETLITAWDTSTHKQRFRRRRPGTDSRMALSADVRVLATPYPPMDVNSLRDAKVMDRPIKQTLRLEDVTTGEPLLTFPMQINPPLPLAFSPDGRLLATNHWRQQAGETTSTVQLWETATATVALALPGALDSKVAFSPDGRLLALSAPSQEILVWDLLLGRERRRFRGFDADVTHLAFSPDGRRLVSGLDDSTLLIWDVGTPGPPRKLGDEDAAKVWADLASTDASRAFRARGVLASAPEEALEVLKERLHPAKAADPQRLRRLLANLESEQFAVREKAQKEFEELGELAEPALRQTLADKPTLEVSRQVKALLDRLRGPVTRPEIRRVVRAVAVMESIGTPAARRLLEELADGAPEARLTLEAKSSLQRLQRRMPKEGNK